MHPGYKAEKAAAAAELKKSRAQALKKQEQHVHIEVVVPPIVKPGDTFVYDLPTGQKEFWCPLNSGPGETINVLVTKQEARAVQLEEQLVTRAKAPRGGMGGDTALVRHWADGLLLAIIDADPARIGVVLDEQGSVAMSSTLQRKLVRGNPIFLLGDRLYNRKGALRDVMGGSFAFEREDVRDRIAAWLEMIDAANGDSLMHILMRVNGIEDEHKAKCAVEFLGRLSDLSASWNTANAEGVIASEIDSAGFKLAWLKELPAWKDEQRRRKRDRQRQAREALAQEEAKRQRDEQRRAEAVRKDGWARMRAQAKEEVKELHERERFHSRLQQSLKKLEAREARQAKVNSAYAELMTDLGALPQKLERWWRDAKWI